MEPLFVGEVDRFFNGQGFNGEVRNINKHLIQAVKGTSFHLLDITPMSELRADAHPSISAGKLHEDCMHWCLPGVTDFWNDMFFALFLDLDNYSTA
ncbi:hypothetical protein O6H91_03G109600 [Diphasiastrum complanatum]|nr:hypothetical protein O6H91_03G109600 [Diphasiastrum complanatum]